MLTSGFVQLNGFFQSKTLLSSLGSPGKEGIEIFFQPLLSVFSVPFGICIYVKRFDRGIFCEKWSNGRGVSLGTMF